MNDLLRSLREEPIFQQIMDQAWGNRPIVPEYVPQMSRDLTENLIERIKFQMAARKGFDDLYRALVGKTKE